MLDLNYYYSFKKHLDFLFYTKAICTVSLSKYGKDCFNYNPALEYADTFYKFADNNICAYIELNWCQYFNIIYFKK
jgi:hypothetical protein